MMKKQLAAAVLAVAVIGGVGTGVVANAMTSDDPATSGSDRPTASEPTSSEPTAEEPTPSLDPDQQGGEAGMPAGDELTIAPGAVGPVKAGMSKDEALATGYFVADAKSPVDGCPDPQLAWKDEYVNTFDVYTLGNGEITSIGIRGDGVVTADGIGVGSTYDEVKAQYPDETLVEAGYVQSGIRVYDLENGGWVGFLFDQTVDTIKGSSKVTFAEVTKGAEPDLMRDGC